MVALSEFIRQSLLFPVLQSIHMVGLIVLVGTISLVDFRLLGVAMRRLAVSDLAAALAPWTAAGLITVFITGPLLFWSDLTRYTSNPAFIVKMGLFAIALTMHFTVLRHAAQRDDVAPQGHSRVAAAISLVLWGSVVLAGRAIADFDIPIG